MNQLSTAAGHIALVDSGIGGLSVLSEIEKRMGPLSISYFMDNLYFPYGKLDQQTVITRLTRIVEFLLENAEPDIFVIACNTASTQSLDFLRRRFRHTFVGVVPAIKPAALASRIGKIGVLATPATVNGRYIVDLINDFASHCEVLSVGSSELVQLAEQVFWQQSVLLDDEIQRMIADIVAPFEQVDHLVLGCTHFPLIKDKIAQALSRIAVSHPVALIDSGEAIARRVQTLLENLALPAQHHNLLKQLFATDPLADHKQLKLVDVGFSLIRHVQVPSNPFIQTEAPVSLEGSHGR